MDNPHPISEQMKDEFYTCEGCFKGYLEKKPSVIDFSDKDDPFVAWRKLSTNTNKRYVCCSNGMAEVLKSFPLQSANIDNIDKFLAYQHGSDNALKMFRCFLVELEWSRVNSIVNSKAVKDKLEELQLKLDVLLDMKRMGELDAKLGKRKRRESF